MSKWNQGDASKSAGNVGIGTTNPNEGKVEVKGGSVCVDTDSNDTATSCIANESDERLKTNITSISASSSLDIITALNPVSFDWRSTDPEVLKHWPLLARYASSTHSIGLIAQQVMPVLPEALSLEMVGDAEVQYYQLDYTKFIPHLVGAIKELWAKVQDLGQKVAALLQSDSEQEAEIETLKARVAALESQLAGVGATAPTLPAPIPPAPAPAPDPEPEPEPTPEGEAEAGTDPGGEISEVTPPSEGEESPPAEGGAAEAAPQESPELAPENPPPADAPTGE